MFKPFSPGSSSAGQIFSEELSGLHPVGSLRQGVFLSIVSFSFSHERNRIILNSLFLVSYFDKVERLFMQKQILSKQ